jgi:hypothetical protein
LNAKYPATKKSKKNATPKKANESSNSVAPIEGVVLEARYAMEKHRIDMMKNNVATSAFPSLAKVGGLPSYEPILNREDASR